MAALEPDPDRKDSPPPTASVTSVTWLGLPRFSWSLALIGLFLYTFVIVTYYVRIADVGIAIAAVGLVLQQGKLRVPFPVWLYGGFVLWAFAASIASPYSDIALDKVVDYLKLLVVMLVVVNALRTEGQLRFFLMFFLACFVLFPVRGTLIGNDEVAGRRIWNYIYNNPNDLATLSLIALGIALGFMFSEASRSLVRVASGVSAMLLLVVILFTQSRGAFIGLVAGMGPGLLWSGLKRPVRLFFYAGVLAAVIGALIPASVWERLSGIEKLGSESTIADADPEGSAAERLEIQKVAWRIATDYPLFGVGLGTYTFANAKYAPELGRKDTHNTYLNLAAEVGFPGLALWVALVVSVLRYAYRRRRLAPPGDPVTQQVWIERALTAYLVAGMFGSYAKLTFPYLVIAVLWCSATLLPSAQRAAGDGARATGA